MGGGGGVCWGIVEATLPHVGAQHLYRIEEFGFQCVLLKSSQGFGNFRLSVFLKRLNDFVFLGAWGFGGGATAANKSKKTQTQPTVTEKNERKARTKARPATLTASSNKKVPNNK